MKPPEAAVEPTRGDVEVIKQAALRHAAAVHLLREALIREDDTSEIVRLAREVCGLPSLQAKS